MKTIRLTIPYNTNVTARITDTRIMRGERNMLLLPVMPVAIPKEVAEGAEPESLQYSAETFTINLGSEIGRRIAIEDLRMGLPYLLKLNDEQILAEAFRRQLEGRYVTIYKTPQKNDPSKYNVRIAPALADASDEDLLSLIRSMCVSHSNSLVDAVGEYPANGEVAF